MEKVIKLGDTITRGIVDSKGFAKHKVRDYRVVGLNPDLKLQEVLIINGYEELGEIEKFDWSISNSLRKLFSNTIFDTEYWSHIWVGNF